MMIHNMRLETSSQQLIQKAEYLATALGIKTQTHEHEPNTLTFLTAGGNPKTVEVLTTYITTDASYMRSGTVPVEYNLYKESRSTMAQPSTIRNFFSRRGSLSRNAL